MKIELKKISYNARLSEETSAYAAQVWVDGVHIADVSNHGTGGPDEQHEAKGKTWKDVEALNNRIKAERGMQKTDLTLNGKPFEMQIDLEAVCGELLTAYLIERDLKRDLARKILFVKPGQKGIYQIKKPIPAHYSKLIELIKEKHKCGLTLNEMPLDKALVVYRENA